MGTSHLASHLGGHLRLCLGHVQRIIKVHVRLQFGVFGAFHGQLCQGSSGRLKVGTVEKGARRWTSSWINEEGLINRISQQLVQLVRRHKVTPLGGKLGL